MADYRRRKIPGDKRGRLPLTETVSVLSTGKDDRVLRFTVSWDIVEKLLQIRDGDDQTLGPWSFPGLRMQFVRFVDDSLPAVLIRLEPVSFDPRAPRLTKALTGRRFYASERAAKLGVCNGILTQRLQTLWAEKMGGLIVQFQEGDMLYAEQNKEPKK